VIVAITLTRAGPDRSGWRADHREAERWGPRAEGADRRLPPAALQRECAGTWDGRRERGKRDAPWRTDGASW